MLVSDADADADALGPGSLGRALFDMMEDEVWLRVAAAAAPDTRIMPLLARCCLQTSRKHLHFNLRAERMKTMNTRAARTQAPNKGSSYRPLDTILFYSSVFQTILFRIRDS